MKASNKTKTLQTIEDALYGTENNVFSLNSKSFYNVAKSISFCPPHTLPDTLQYQDDETKKRFAALGIHSTEMEYIDTKIIPLEEIDLEFFSSKENIGGRYSPVDAAHVARLVLSLSSEDGWMHSQKRLYVVEIPENRMAEILRDDPHSKKKYWLFSGRHRITGLQQLFAATKNSKYNFALVDLFKYNNYEALEAHGTESNMQHTVSKPLEMIDIESSFINSVKRNLFESSEDGFARFLKFYKIQGKFSATNIKKMMKRALKRSSYDAIDGRVETIESGQNVKRGTRPHLTWFTSHFDVPFASKDVRISDVLRDKLPTDGSIRYVTLFVDSKDCFDNPKGIKGERENCEKKFKAKLKALATMRYNENVRSGCEFPSSHPLANATKEDIINHYMENGSIQFNGFMPQLISPNGDIIEKVIVNANGTPFKGFVSKSSL